MIHVQILYPNILRIFTCKGRKFSRILKSISLFREIFLIIIIKIIKIHSQGKYLSYFSSSYTIFLFLSLFSFSLSSIFQWIKIILLLDNNSSWTNIEQITRIHRLFILHHFFLLLSTNPLMNRNNLLNNEKLELISQ